MEPKDKTASVADARADEVNLETAHVASVAEIAQPTEGAPEAMMAVAAMTPEALAEEVVAKDALSSGSRNHGRQSSGLSPFVWVTALVLIVIALMWFFAAR